MTKVLIILPQLWTGGIQKVNIELAANMKDPDIDLTILSLYPYSGSNFDKQAEEQGIKVKYLDKKPGVDLSIIPKINRFFKEYKPDVIHINQRMTTYVLIPMLINRIKRRMYVVHSLADKDAKGIPRKINKFAFQHLKLIPVAVSDTCLDSMADVYDLPKERIKCIYNGVDTEKFKRKTPYEKMLADTCTFVTACAFRKVKNLPLLVDAFAIVHKKHPSSRLIIVGDAMEGEEYMAEELKDKIASLGLQNSIELPGRQDDIPAWLEKGHVYVLSSDFEGLPVSVLEAMSAALPIVTTDAGGVVDIVKDGENGFIVPVGGTAQLVDAMLKLVKHPETRLSFSQKSEELAQNYSVVKCAERYAQLYKGEL